MELQLGLGLPNHGVKWFDLNTPKDGVLSSHGGGFDSNKRDFEEAFEKGGAVIKTLPLLWKDEADYEDDAASNSLDKADYLVNKSAVVGWPPIKSSRKLQCSRGSIGDGGSNSQYVKVKMEGVAIGRKIDLSLSNSYHTLTCSLNYMFGILEKDCVSMELPNYKLTYQDKDGDWMLVGDVPWGTFVETVRRLKIKRCGE
ncbi:auxin-responsive protein IAA31-like isoform X2 [Tasmannia lanceolata]|uniref:auxin-responsive protein IAA31-like isoform X2 n=1 Tax=Tasmannia lanceolata TaxID=3420 RepID=UPI004062A1DF